MTVKYLSMLYHHEFRIESASIITDNTSVATFEFDVFLPLFMIPFHQNPHKSTSIFGLGL